MEVTPVVPSDDCIDSGHNETPSEAGRLCVLTQSIMGAGGGGAVGQLGNAVETGVSGSARTFPGDIQGWSINGLLALACGGKTEFPVLQVEELLWPDLTTPFTSEAGTW